MGNTQDLQFLFRQADAPKHKAVSAKGLNRVDSHAAHQFLDLMPPCGHQIHKPLAANIRVQPLHQLRTLGGNAPVALAALTAAAQVAAHRQQRSRGNIAGIGTQRNGLDHIRCAADAAANHQRNIISDTFVPEPLIHSRQGQLNGDAHIVPDPGRRGTGTTPEAVDGNDFRATAGNTTGNGCNIMNSSNLHNHRFFIFRGFFQ